MYEKLVKRLKEDKSWIEQGTTETEHEIAEHIQQAADAIEELSKLADAIPHVCECCVGCELETMNGGCDHAFVLSPKRAMQYLIKPRWIPVMERLPEEHKWVLVFDERWAVPMMAFREGGEWINMRYTSVTHWMPLPKPPKEECK